MRLLIILLSVVTFACAEDAPSNEVRATGHVEATEVRLAPKIGGRLATLSVKEGDRVEQGALVAQIDPRDTELALDRAKADRVQAEAQLSLVRAGSRREEIAQAEAQAEAARDESQCRACRTRGGGGRSRALRGASPLERRLAQAARRCGDEADVARERVQAAESRARAADQATARLRAGARPQEIDGPGRVSRRPRSRSPPPSRR